MSTVFKSLAAVFVCGVVVMPSHVRADAVNWVPDADGDWIDAFNWAPHAPGAADDVTIDVAGVRTTTHGAVSGLTTILSLVSNESLEVSDSGLAVTGLATFGGGGIGLTVSGTGASFTANTGPTTIDDVNLFSSDGAAMNLQGAASYTALLPNFTTRTIEATGANSTLDLSNATSVNLNTSGISSFLDIRAQDGGGVDLRSATSISSSAGGVFNFPHGTRVAVQGANSQIDLSSLTTMEDNQDFAGARSSITVGDSGVVVSPSLTTLRRVKTIDIDGAGSSIDTSAVTSFTDGVVTLSNGATTDLGALVTMEAAGFDVAGGVTLDVPNVTSIVNNQAQDTPYQAREAGSTLNMNGVGSIANQGVIFGLTTRIGATDGGTVNMTGLTDLLAEAGLINSSREIHVLAEGQNSVVNLTALERFEDLASVTRSSIIATDHGVVNLNALGTTQLTNVAVLISQDATVTGDTAELVSVSTPTSSDTPDLSTLAGNGVLMANLVNTSGVVGPGESVGNLTVDGGYFQGIDGLLEIEIQDSDPGNFDVLTILGDADLGGVLRVTVDPGYVPVDGDTFVILTASAVLNPFDVEDLPGLGLGLNMVVDYGLENVTLRVLVPEPATLGMVGGFAGLALLTRRRRYL